MFLQDVLAGRKTSELLSDSTGPTVVCLHTMSTANLILLLSQLFLLPIAAGVITGDIKVSGFPKEQKTFARVMGCA